MKDKLAKLIDVKTIITFSLVAATIVLAFKGLVDPKEISALTLMAVSFFLGYKANKPT
jgi:hypothetical protein